MKNIPPDWLPKIAHVCREVFRLPVRPGWLPMTAGWLRSGLLWLLLVGCLSPAGAGSLAYRRDVQYSFYEPPARTPAGGRTFFYAQWEPYELMQNFMGYWIDRPLLTDVTLRGREDGREEGYLREVKLLQNYGIDGFASLDYLDAYRNKLAIEAKHREEFEPYGLTHLPVAPMYYYPDDYALLREYFKVAVNAPQSPRIGGKAVIFRYGAATPKELKELSERLKSDPEIGDRFLLFGDMPFYEFHADFARYAAAGQTPPPEFLTAYRNAVREMLDAADGLILQVKDIASSSREMLDEAVVLPWYRDYMLPIILAELDRPEYRGKLLGAYLQHAYINPMSGNNVGEYGTRQFRLCFDEALRTAPDLLVFFEWNEANENTSFQPTVANSYTYARLIRYYIRRLRGEPPSPMPGDDLAVPNLVLSSRQRARLGELINYEILNIPDGTAAASLQAQLLLRDADGGLLMEFPAETVETAKLMAISYRVATETLAGQAAVVPELHVTDNAGQTTVYTGFDYTELRPTENWRYKETHQPLRDLCVPSQNDFEATANPDGTFTIGAHLRTAENLRTLEVLNRHEEAAAADSADEFNQDRCAVILGTFTSMDLLLKTTGTFRVLNAKDWEVRSDGLAHGLCEVTAKTPDEARVYTYFWWMRSTFILKIPRQYADRAILELDYPDGVGCHRFSIREILEQGKLAKSLNRNIRLDLERADRLVDYPAPLNRPDGRLDAELHSPERFPVFQLRAITDSGKIYRSRPIVPRRPAGAVETLPVFSEFHGKVVPVEIASETIPQLDYQFGPNRGAMLGNAFEPFYDAQLGGGFSYLEPMHKTPVSLLPADYRSFAPAWREEDGAAYLSFDGVSNYVNFPRAALPRGPFTLEIELRTPGDREQVLFRNFAYDFAGTLQLVQSRDNELIASYAVGTWNQPFATGLTIPRNRWSRIKVNYDHQQIKFSVDEKSKTFPFFSRGYTVKPSAFGGTTVPNGPVGAATQYFKGDLRKFSIRHNSEPLEN